MTKTNAIVSFNILNKVWRSFEIDLITKKKLKNLNQDTRVTQIT